MKFSHAPHTPEEQAAGIRPFVLFSLSLLLFLIAGSLFISLAGMYFGLMLTHTTAILGTALIYRHFRNKQGPIAPTWPTFRRTNTSAANLGLILFTTVILGLFANLFGALLIELIPPLKPIAEESQKAMADLLFNASVFEQILGAISIAIFAPICEETLFRGTILPEQRPHLPRRAAPAILINGILFSAMHVDPVSFAPLVIVGAFFAFITVRTNSILPAIFAHAALNTVNGIILPRLVGIEKTAEQDPSITALIALAIPLALALTGLWIWLSRRLSTTQTARSVATNQ